MKAALAAVNRGLMGGYVLHETAPRAPSLADDAAAILFCAVIAGGWPRGVCNRRAVTGRCRSFSIGVGVGLASSPSPSRRRQRGALLNRDLEFSLLGMAEIIGLAIPYGVSILLAVLFRSYWALVAGTLAGGLVQTLLYWHAASFRPSRPHLRGVGPLARFGGQITGFSLLNFCVRNMDDVLVARFSGVAAAGLYDRSYR